MAQEIKAIDGLITPNIPGRGAELERALGYLFKEMAARVGRGTTLEQLVEEMDEAGVERGVLSIQSDDQRDWVLRAVELHPRRFIAAIVVNPHLGMEELRKVERMARDHGLKVIRLGPWRIQKPPNDKIYYPFYAKAIELGIAVQVNVGMPGPKFPGWVQDPIYLDEVCWFFPELKLVMTHIGEPWVGTVIKLLVRWPNAYLLTNSFAPRHYPQELIQFMNTRGADNVLWGTEYPMLPFLRCIEEIKTIPLRDHVRPKFLRENALKVFDWGER